MNYIKNGKIEWQEEINYIRGLILPFKSSSKNKFQIQLTKIKAHDQVSDHYHKNQIEVFYVISGTSEFTFSDRSIKVSTGDVLVIEPGEVHSTTNRQDEESIFFVVKIDVNENDTVWL